MDQNGFYFLFGRRGILFTNGVRQVEMVVTEKQCNSPGYWKRTSATRQQCSICIYNYFSGRILS